MNKTILSMVNVGLIILRSPLMLVKIIIINFIKPHLIKIWAKEIIQLLPDYQKQKNTPRNIMIDQSTKKSIKPLELSFEEIYTSWPNKDLRSIMFNAAELTTVVYRDYINPIHIWCINNFKGDFCFWHDGRKVQLIIIDPHDRTLWALIWDNKLPNPREAINLKNTN